MKPNAWKEGALQMRVHLEASPDPRSVRSAEGNADFLWKLHRQGVGGGDSVDLYASGTSSEALRTALVPRALSNVVGQPLM